MKTYVREPINGFTHLAGAILSFIALLAMVIKTSVNSYSPLNIAAVIVFGISMVLLYAASATYHMVVAKEAVISFLRRLDHSMIFILIAGTYTPFCLISLKGTMGWLLFSLVTGIALLGIIFKLVWFHCPRWLSTALYIGMGWLIIFFAAPLAENLHSMGLNLLILGGVLYTIGGIIYGIKPKFLEMKHWGYHEIFHIFIMLGTLAHFLSVFLYVI